MKRLIDYNKNLDPSEYDRIYQARKEAGVHWQDIRRWKELIRYFEGGKIIDIGCLDSMIPDFVLEYYHETSTPVNYLGTDVAKEAIREMIKRYPFTNSSGGPLCGFIVDDIYKSQVKDEIADYLVLGEVLEHMETPADVVRQAFKILRPGGILAISVPFNEAIEPGAVDGDRHLWSFEKQDLQDLVEVYSTGVKFKILRSKYFPKYQYCFPQLICWAWKK